MYLQLPVCTCSVLYVPVASCSFLYVPVASCSFLFVPAASCIAEAPPPRSASPLKEPAAPEGAGPAAPGRAGPAAPEGAGLKRRIILLMDGGSHSAQRRIQTNICSAASESSQDLHLKIEICIDQQTTGNK
ncbi:hypothetical protein F7725_025692, partial [Dissostichus mawsoni]